METNSGAEFSACRTFRYRLWRDWDRSPGRMLFVMLNPSTADEVANDPTVERCERRARAMGFSGVEVVNLFAYRSTSPKALYVHPDEKIGEDNDAHIMHATMSAQMIVCAWGAHGKLLGRGDAVRQMFREAGLEVHALQVNQDGTPKHPLYVSYRVTPSVWA